VSAGVTPWSTKGGEKKEKSKEMTEIKAHLLIVQVVPLSSPKQALALTI
jgi:hypothetical protein